MIITLPLLIVRAYACVCIKTSENWNYSLIRFMLSKIHQTLTGAVIKAAFLPFVGEKNTALHYQQTLAHIPYTYNANPRAYE